jgi:hypothetical protein
VGPEPEATLRDLDRILTRIGPVLRWRHVIVTVAAFVFAVHSLRGNQAEWSYFYDGSRLLFNGRPFVSAKPGGLHLYANYPWIQIGPLGLLLAVPFRWIGYEAGRIVASFMMTAVAPLLVFLLEATANRVQPATSEVDEARRHVTVLIGGLLVVQSWTSLAVVYGHLDDVLVLSTAVLVLWAVTQNRWFLTGLLLGVAIAAKPWGIIFVPLILVLPRGKRLNSALIAGAVAAASWGPFFLADSRTFSAGRVQDGVSPNSVLHLFGVALGSAPTWVRPAQIVLALLAGSWLVSKGRWGAVLLVGIALRIALDTNVFLYYDTGLVLAAFAWDMMRSRRPIPVWTISTFALVNVTHGLTLNPRVQAVSHLAATLAPIALLLIRHDLRTTRPASHVHDSDAGAKAKPQCETPSEARRPVTANSTA